MKGKVKWYNSMKGFGFIEPEDGSKDIFVHRTAVEAAGVSELAEGQEVEFEVEKTDRGSQAVNLKL